MKQSLKKGLSFGLTSGIITTLGLIVGLNSSTNSKAVVISGILVIAIADALSDGMGIHISEESSTNASEKAVWESTLSTVGSKFLFAMSFIIPFLLFSLNAAVIISIIYGLTLISVFSYFIAKFRSMKPSHVIAEHLIITVVVVGITHFVGLLVGSIG